MQLPADHCLELAQLFATSLPAALRSGAVLVVARGHANAGAYETLEARLKKGERTVDMVAVVFEGKPIPVPAMAQFLADLTQMSAFVSRG